MTSNAPHIVHVIYRLAVGGLENGLVNLLNHLPRQVWRHSVVSLTDIDYAFARRIDRDDIELVALNKGPGHALDAYPRLWRLFRRMRPAIVHTRNLAALEVAPVAWAAGVPVRLHGEHGRDARDPELRDPRRRRIRRLYRPFVDRYVAVSPDLADYLCHSIGVGAERVDQIYNGVDTTRFAPAPERVPIDGCPFDASHWIAGTVGRLEAVKDHANLVRAFACALEQHPALRRTLRLVIVGEGPERARVEALLEQHRMRELVWLAGERHDVPALLRGLDLFVLPSLGEGVSNTILEAMASGLPVLATDVGANANLVAHGETGTIVPASAPEALGQALAMYAGNSALARTHGEAARARVEQRFSLERMVERYHDLYRSLVHGPSRESAARRATDPRLLH